MPYPQRSLHEILTLIQQSRKLLVRMYERYFEETPFSQEEILNDLAEDQQRMQALLDRGIIENEGKGYRLAPSWMIFFQSHMLGQEAFSLSNLKHQIHLAREILHEKNTLSLPQQALIHLRTARKEWQLLLNPHSQIDQGSYPELRELRSQWNELVWKDLQKYWGVSQTWDSTLIPIWEEAEEIGEKLAFLDQGFSSKEQILPHFLLSLLKKKEENLDQLKASFADTLEENTALFFQNHPSRSTRPSLSFFAQKESFALAKKIKGRKKITFSPQKKDSQPLSKSSSLLPIQGLLSLLEDFSQSELELMEFLGSHPISQELSPEEQLELYYLCLFQYQDQLDIQKGDKKSGKPKVYFQRKE